MARAVGKGRIGCGPDGLAKPRSGLQGTVCIAEPPLTDTDRRLSRFVEAAECAVEANAVTSAAAVGLHSNGGLASRHIFSLTPLVGVTVRHWA